MKPILQEIVIEICVPRFFHTRRYNKEDLPCYRCGKLLTHKEVALWQYPYMLLSKRAYCRGCA